TVKAYLERWLSLVKPKVAPTTYQRYEQHVRLHLVPHIGRVKLAKLTPLHVEQLLATMGEAGDSAAERNKTGVALRMALKQACRMRLIPYNVASDVPLPTVSKDEMRPLDPVQMGVFLAAAAEDRLAALYVLALDSGMRQGELFALHWPEVYFDSGAVFVRQSLEDINGRVRLKD